MKPILNGNRRQLGAFTLIELLVVIIIIAALSALIVPNIGSFGRSTDMAVSAKTQADVANSVNQFFVLQKRFPQGLDSLLDGTGALYGPDVNSADNQVRGFPYAGADGTRLANATGVGQLQASTLGNATNAEYLRSLTRAGLDWVWDHDTAAINSNNSNTVFRSLVDNIVSPGVAGTSTVTTPVPVAELTNNGALRAKLHPTPLKSTERIVAFGYGQNNTAIGKLSTTCPLYPGSDKTYYGRYILYFKVYASGERATLVGVSDSYGRTPDYTGQQFNESLPDGSRQG
ncbi:MAG: prepilin-type N-terminal cleavage/methylation domain-containing protein [Verrucomicrobiota bacterium]